MKKIILPMLSLVMLLIFCRTETEAQEAFSSFERAKLHPLTYDRAMQVHGRYGDMTNYGYMDKMGIWFENFALPVVVNECMMQSYNGTIRFFPNWPMEKDAEFHNLRTAGAFLVSAILKDGKVKEIRIYSEAGAPLKMILPWENGATLKNNKGTTKLSSNKVEINTAKGEVLVFRL